MKKTSPQDLKKVLYAIEHPKANIDAFATDGIELAYQYAKESYEDNYENKVIMVRLPERKSEVRNSIANLQPTATVKPRGNGAAVVLSALALLPELISVIKN